MNDPQMEMKQREIEQEVQEHSSSQREVIPNGVQEAEQQDKSKENNV